MEVKSLQNRPMMLEKQHILRVSLLLSLLLSAHAAQGQCANKLAKQHLESANSYRAADDERAEQEYRRAIALAKGRCADAWAGLSFYLSEHRRFSEAADAWHAHIKHIRPKPNDLLLLRLLKRAAELHSRSLTSQPLSADEMVELVGLVDRFAEPTDAIPFAENAVKVYPESAKALVALANLISSTQQERALELLNRAATLADKETSVFIARGWYFIWVQFKPREAEKDFRRALELSNGTSASAWQGLGDSLSRQGRRNEAIQAYLRYLKIRPQHASHYDEVIKRDIEALRNLP
jgi:Tfp pilus assembly protein PilF